MTFKPVIQEINSSDYNEDSGLYQFVVTLTNQAKCRLFFSKDPEWKITAVNRLLNIPCPVCRKDYYCNCMSKYAAEFEQQMLETNRLP
ncbi:hypothetical protein IDH44_13685 [Paenibacillus sp. IB182496]|uniref:Uncharacterized protein n=1 Tax=Paenibacillus sabuli TaxID=2772509 RepID=A0A927BT13_9BACL|nr:hypothetical protein [Paenibacillus sabuli]MBD2846252.1 hypothetical protein [Paenibacillus sabuli]